MPHRTNRRASSNKNTQLSKTLVHALSTSENLKLVVEPNTKKVFLITIAPDDAKPMYISITVTVERDATCDVVLLQEPSKSHCTIEQHSTLADRAHIAWHVITLGQGKIEQNIRSDIHGNNAESSIDWIFFARNTDDYKLSVRNVFMAPEGRGEITMKGVAEDKAHVSAHGMIEIGPKGAGTDTYLTQDVLMLDRTAKVDAVPGLEIKTNDVKASHSATVRHVSPDDLFYFGSRGIAQSEARRVYIEGFLKDLTEKISDADVRERVLRELKGKLESGVA